MPGDDGNPSREPPPEVTVEWWLPFEEFLAKERRYSPYTVRNYRQAFDDFHGWLRAAGLWEAGFDALDARACRREGCLRKTRSDYSHTCATARATVRQMRATTCSWRSGSIRPTRP